MARLAVILFERYEKSEADFFSTEASTTSMPNKKKNHQFESCLLSSVKCVISARSNRFCVEKNLPHVLMH